MTSITVAIFITLLAVSNGAVIQTQSAHVTGEIVNEADGSVTLTVSVHGGSPAANVITWRLSDGSTISANEAINTADYKTSSVGKSNPLDGPTITYMLHVLKGYTTVAQSFEFRAEYNGQPGWWRTFSFSLPATTVSNNRPVVTDTVFGELKGEQVDNADSDGTYKLTVSVLGGNPKADTFQWELQDSRVIKPGHDDSEFGTGAWSVTPGVVHHVLTLKNGLSSSATTITFRAAAENAWWATQTFNIPSKAQAIVQEAGSITGSSTISNGVTTINAVIKGGHPAANTYKWTVQQPDGSFRDITPGQTGASSVTSNTAGEQTLSLTVSGSASIWRSVKLYVTSENNGFLSWWASFSWWVRPTTA